MHGHEFEYSKLLKDMPIVFIVYMYMQYDGMYAAQDPLTYTLAEGMGTPVPRPLLTVAASELDGDTITYAIDPSSVSYMQDSESLSDRYDAYHNVDCWDD